MKRNSHIGIQSYSVLNSLKNLSSFFLRFHSRLESLYFKKIFRGVNSGYFTKVYPKSVAIDFEPVFVLSTGRCGTKTVAALMDLSPEIQAYHEPYPKLFQESYLYYNGLSENVSKEFWEDLIQFARGNLMRRAYWLDRKYFESNNRLSLFTDILLSIYPQAKFVHMVRHPYDFINSAMKKGFYKDNVVDFLRIHPRPLDEHYSGWNKFSRYEKCSWLWAKTNQNILDFLEAVPQKKKMFLKAEEIFSGNHSELTKLYKFVIGENNVPKRKTVEKVLKKKLNKASISSSSLSKNDEIKNLYLVQKHSENLLNIFGYGC